MDSNNFYKEQPGTEPDNNGQDAFQNNDVYQSGGYQSGDAYQQGNAYQSGDAYQQGSAYQSGDAYQQGSAYQSGDAYQQGNAYQNNGAYQSDGAYQQQSGYPQYGQSGGYNNSTYNNNYNNGNYSNSNYGGSYNGAYNSGGYQSPYQSSQLDLEEPVKMSEWLISMLLMMVPCLNIVMMFVWAFSKTEKKSKSNFFKAYLIVFGIIFALYILIMIFVVALGLSLY